MSKGRLEAFSDGVIAIIITIMVLEMKVPHGDRSRIAPSAAAGVPQLRAELRVRRHLLEQPSSHAPRACRRVSGAVLWANLHLLFWLSLFPFATGWMGENHFAAVPIGALWRGAADGWLRVLHPAAHVDRLRRARGPCCARRSAATGRGSCRSLLYVVAMMATAWRAWIAQAIYAAVALLWLVPDRRIERAMIGGASSASSSDDRAR